MRTARTVLFSGAFALQTICAMIFAETPKVGVKEALLLRRITEYWKEGHYQDAKVQLKVFLSTYPSSPYLNEIYAMLGDLYLQEGAPENALDYYQKIQSKECEELVALHKAEALYQLERYEDLLQWVEAKKELLSAENRIHLLLGDAYYRKTLKETDPTLMQAEAAKAIEEFSLVQNLDKEWNLVIAHLLSLRGEKLKAADLYLSLAKESSEKKDQLLLQAAFLLEHTEVKKAISLLHEVASLPGDLQKDAALNELVLLFREKCYEEFLLRQKEYAFLVDPETSPTLFYYIGHAYYELGNFEEAGHFLKLYVASSPASKENARTSLKSLFFCGYKTQNLDLIKTGLAFWKTSLPLDDDYLDGLRTSASIYLEQKKYEEAKEALKEIVDGFPSHHVRTIALWDYSQVLLCLDQLPEAKKALDILVETCSESPYLASAWQNLIFINTELLKNAERAERDALKKELAACLKKALENPSLFDDESLRSYRLHLTHLLFDLGEFKDAYSTAENYLDFYSDHESAREVRFIQISCHLSLGLPITSLIDSIEQALKIEPDANLQARLHLQLFNAYLSQGVHDQAYTHLLAVYKDGSLPIKSENLLWLADELDKQNDPLLTKEVLNKALGPNNSLDPLVFEESLLKLKDLHMNSDEFEEALSLLLQLAERQKLHSDIEWKYVSKTKFELAQLEERLGKIDDALKTYEELSEGSLSEGSYYLKASVFRKAMIQLSQLPASEKHDGSLQLLSILGALKDLQIARSVSSEPLHLEAALEYASIRCSLLPSQEQTKRKIFYLQRIEEDFLADTSDISTAYIQQRYHWPEQDRLIDRYMRYIAAERKRLKAEESQKNGDLERSISLTAVAKEELQSLLRELSDSSSLLKERVLSSLMSISG